MLPLSVGRREAAVLSGAETRIEEARASAEAPLRLRGIECNSPTSHAEAIHCRKAVLA